MKISSDPALISTLRTATLGKLPRRRERLKLSNETLRHLYLRLDFICYLDFRRVFDGEN
jgi:hypothetical protein